MTPLPSWVRRNRSAVAAGNARLNTSIQQMKARHSKYLAMLKASGGYSVPLSGASSALPLSAANSETNTPLVAQEAQGNNSLDVSQRGAVIGEVIPIVFARRVSGVGGVLISPAATEARFENSLTNEVTGFYHLVLGEGPMDSLQVRDVFQRSCRVGSFSQTYNNRAGTFIPGNFIVARAGYTVPECPSYCGTGGTYTGLSTLAFQATYPDGNTQWNRQVHCFVRGGLHVTRLLDSTLGPSNNVVDLLRYLLRSSSRVPDAQIDAAGSFLTAATFTNVNGFWFNGSINASTNLRDWIGRNLQYFLLRLVRIAGKESLKPLLPTNSNGTIKTTAVDWEFAFTEEHIIPDTFEINYTPLADRKPFAVMVLWRQQDDLGIPLIRTAEVRYAGTAEDGPFEQHDLSQFCASEDHAVKIGTYILSRRNHITHRLRIGVKPDVFNPTLAAGDRVRVRLERTPSTGAASVHDYLYEVDRIGKSISGEVRLELTHFPIDDTFASVVAKEVNAAVGAGFVLPTGLSGITCDVNSSGDTSIPADTSFGPGGWNIPPDGSFDAGSFDAGSFDAGVTEIGSTDLDDMPESSIEDLAEGGVGGLGGFGGFYGGGGGGSGGKDNQQSAAVPSITSSGNINNPIVGDTLTTPIICEGGRIRYYRLDSEVEGGKVYLSEGPTYTMVINDADYSVYSEIECPDPTSPTGYGEPIASAPLAPVAMPAGGVSYNFWNFPNFSATITTTRSRQLTVTRCSDNVITQDEVPNPTTNTFSVNGKSFFVVTRNIPLGLANTDPAGWLAASGSPGTGAACGVSGFYNRNGSIISNQGTELTASYVAQGIFGSNINMLSDSSYSGSHTTSIVSIVLNENVAGLGVIGEEISGLGTYSNLPYPPN